jgi:alanine dehydrogenase
MAMKCRWLPLEPSRRPDMITFVSEQDVRANLTLAETIEALDLGFRALAAGQGEVVARRRVSLPGGKFHWMPASLVGAGVVGAKLYTTFGEQRQSYVVLFDAHTGRLVAVIESYELSMMRTGAATAIATRHLARTDARVLAMIGTGSTAVLQVKAVAAVRRIDEVRVFGRSVGLREALAKQLAEELGTAVKITAALSCEAAVRGADIVNTSTNSPTPILDLAWLAPGTHLNVIGSNFPDKREIGPEILCAAERVVADALVSAREEAGDLVMAVEEGRFTWDRVDELSHVVAGMRPGRVTQEGITIFKSVGVAVEDLASASHLMRRLLERAVPQPEFQATGMP